MSDGAPLVSASGLEGSLGVPLKEVGVWPCVYAESLDGREDT